MTSWNDFATAQPDLARTVEERFAGYDHHVIATLRADGSPRVSGVEATFRSGELWLGMMPSSRKALDLLRDPRFALHVNPGPGQSMGGGDVRVAGRAVEVTDAAGHRAFAGEVRPPGPFHLFRVEVGEVVRVWVEDDDLLTRVWTPARGLRTFRRGTDDAPAQEG